MMYFLFVFSFLIYSHQITNDDDYEKYEKAYEYIVNSEYLKEELGDHLLEPPDTISIFVTNQVLSFAPGMLVYKIRDYNLSLDDSTKRINLGIGKNGFKKVIDTNFRFSDFNINKNFNVLLFFSELKDNMLIAKLTIYNSKCPILNLTEDGYFYFDESDCMDYNQISDYGSFILFLFIFDNNKIDRVFNTHVAMN